MEMLDGDETVWVHDYQLMLVPKMVRDRASDCRIRFFLHVPFPPIEVYARLPWRREILEGLLGAEVVGFQTERAARNFAEAVATFTDREVTKDSVGGGPRSTHLVTAPISIDVGDFERIAGAPEAKERSEQLRRRLGDPSRIVLGVDRLDYTKGIDVRLLAFEALLDGSPQLAADTRFIQIAVPSRESIDDYAAMRSRIEEIAGRINGAHGGHHVMPVHYIHGALHREDLVAYYGAADVMCVTPLADGMNLVAKEYVASRVDGGGVLVLSEFAGAAHELEAALLVNPYDVEGVVRALDRAIEMPASDRANRMQILRRAVHANDVHTWVRRALAIAETTV
jgi:trehalose-6-phosphate synthase